eukprot:CAMPEP_0175310034 /NCGR_PEP_ID=MMETSP0093-20121207/66110_1 /TAXON_ID=311494 /ORGANISM="Alexandrium monilatum, Strain CCMP3105" /LENGTH=45 /DNA_ID= /DNA_START= /DNA_END= /DNA_ORIENTATION=
MRTDQHRGGNRLGCRRTEKPHRPLWLIGALAHWHTGTPARERAHL